MRRSERINRRLVGKRRIHHVEPLEKHLLVARSNVEMPVPICARYFNRLRREVDRELHRLRLRENRKNLRPVLRRHPGSKEAVVEAVRIEDFTEGGRNDDADAVLHQSPDGMFAARAAAEVGAGCDDLRLLKPRAIENAVVSGRAVRIHAEVPEEPLSEPGLVDPVQELLRHQLVGVEIVDVDGCGDRGEGREPFHFFFPPDNP